MKAFVIELKASRNELKNVQTISVGGMLIAVSIVLSFFKVFITQTLAISFAFIPIAAGGMLFGPVVGGIMGILNDILGYLVKPNGPFFPGFTLSALISGFIYGFFLYKKQASLIRVASAVGLNTLIVNLLLNSFWLSVLYGNGFDVLLTGRFVKNLIMFPIETVMLLSILKLVERIKIRDRARS